MRITPTILLAAAGSTTATHLYVSSYSGFVRTLNLHKGANHAYNLEPVATSRHCGPSPSWLTVNKPQHALLCVNEGLTTQYGSLTSYYRETNGTLAKLDSARTIGGPVSSVIFGRGNPHVNPGVALAHYGGSAVSTFSLNRNDLTLSHDQHFTFRMAHPGPVADRQEAPHPHQVVLDPTRRFIIVPDLGADVIRIFRINHATNRLTELKPFKVTPGSGPRHAAFWSPTGGNKHYLYVVSELSNSLAAYAVTYHRRNDNDKAEYTLRLRKVYQTNTFGGGSVPAGAATAEIAVSPDNRFLIVSNRGDNSFSIPSMAPGAAPGDMELSDSLASFRLQRDGSLVFKQLSPAGGSFPRQFSINKAGDLVAVGLQYSHRVVIIARDIKTGQLGNPVAYHFVEGQVTSVMWEG